MTRIDIQLKAYLEQIGVTAYTLGKWQGLRIWH